MYRILHLYAFVGMVNEHFSQDARNKQCQTDRNVYLDIPENFALPQTEITPTSCRMAHLDVAKDFAFPQTELTPTSCRMAHLDITKDFAFPQT
jgi:predicted protein tyrosine phosphatase